MKKLLLLLFSISFLFQISNAQTWLPMSTNMTFEARNLEVLNGVLYASGPYFKEFKRIGKLDGNQWQSLGEGVGTKTKNDNWLTAIALYNDEIYAAGAFNRSGSKEDIVGIARWNGEEWNDVGKGFSDIASVIHDFEVYKGELYGAGDFIKIGGQKISYIAKWDGKSWSPVGPGLSGPVYDLFVFKDELYAGGQFHSTAGKSSKEVTWLNGVGKWDGEKWSAVGKIPGYIDLSRPLSVGDTHFDKIHHLAVFNNEVYAIGYFNNAKSQYSHCIQRWDGAEWIPLPKQIEFIYTDMTRISDVAAYKNGLYVVGGFAKAGDTKVKNIAKWDGKEWSDCGGGINGYIRTLTVYNDELIVSGIFDKAGGKAISEMARYKE